MKKLLGKKFTVLVVGAVMALSAVFGIVMMPFHSSGLFANISALSSSLTHEVRANYSLTRLPRRTAMVGSPIGVPETTDSAPNRYPFFQLVRTSGANSIILHEHTDRSVRPFSQPLDITYWEFAGTYEFRFFATSDLAGTSSNPQQPFHIHPVQVSQNHLSFVLPTNSEDILPNVSVPHMDITLPIPTSFYDTRGNDLFEIRRNSEGRLEVPHIERLVAFYADTPSGINPNQVNRPANHGTWIANTERYQFELLEFYRNIVLQDTRVHFFGLDGEMHNRSNLEITNVANRRPFGDALFTPNLSAEELRLRRTFRPEMAFNNYFAEYRFQHRYDRNAVANLRTNSITVENVGATVAQITGQTDARSNQIRFEHPPSPAFTPGGLRLHEEIGLPSVTVALSRAPRFLGNETEVNPAFNPVMFNTTENISNFSFVRAEIFTPVGSSTDRNDERNWRLARTPEWVPAHGDGSTITDANSHGFYYRIIDLGTDRPSFIPTELGEYRFTYFTTTIFGAGFNYAEFETDQLVWIHANGTPIVDNLGRPTAATPNQIQAGATRVIRFSPFGKFFLSTDNVAPRIMWTDQFGYNNDGAAVYLERDINGNFVVVNDEFVNTDRPVVFETTDNFARYLPGSGANSRTQIVGGAARPNDNANMLILPALLGWDNETASEDLIYNITIRRTVPGSTQATSVTFSNANEATAPGLTNGGSQPYDNRFPLIIDFSVGNAVRFLNGPMTAHGVIPNPVFQGTLHGANSLLPGSASVNARYDITVWARDLHVGQGPEGLGLPSAQLVYSFEVVPNNIFNAGMGQARPEFQGGMGLRQTAYYEGDNVIWRAVNPRDDFTDTANIDVVYMLFVKGDQFAPVRADEFFDITEYVEVVGGNAIFELDARESEIASELLELLEQTTRSVLDVTILAVARNFFALNNPGHEFDEQAWIDGNDQPIGVEVTSAEFRIYSIDFGSAPTIRGRGTPYIPEDAPTSTPAVPADPDALVQFEREDGTWQERLTSANVTAQNPTGRPAQYNRVFLPEFIFQYEDLAQGIESSISFAITQPGGARLGTMPFASIARTEIPGYTQAPLSSHRFLPAGNGSDPLTGPLNTRRGVFFIPNRVGDHLLTVTVTNAGGNVTVFMATIRVYGEVHYNLAVQGGISEMRVGQNASLPNLTITIHGHEFITDGVNIVADFDVPSGANRNVGSFFVLGWADNGATVDFRPEFPNEFTPNSAGTFNFEYVIEISRQRLYDVGIPIRADGSLEYINASITHQVIVTTLQDGDIGIEIDNAGFAASRDHFEDYELFVSQFASPTVSEGVTTITVSDYLLEQTMQQSDPLEVTPTAWMYGNIILPDWQVVMTNGLNMPIGFNDPENGVQTHITVQAPRVTDPKEFILDTREEEHRNNFSRQITRQENGRDITTEHFWFRPIGEVNRPDITNATQDNRINPDVFADGIYIVTYVATFQGISASVVFHIQIGDVAVPTIYFDPTSGEYERLFTQTWTNRIHGDNLFTIDTNYIRVDANGGKTDFLSNRRYIAENLTIEVLRPDGTSAAFTPYGDGEREAMERGDIRRAFSFGGNDRIPAFQGSQHPTEIGNTASGMNDFDPNMDPALWGRQVWDMWLTQAGNYTITLRILSESGVEGIFQRSVTVEAEPPPSVISPTTIWGIVLIILASGIFLGVVIYFVKTGRQTRFASVADKKIKADTEKPDMV